MLAALLMTGCLALMCVLVALGPRRLPRQLENLDQHRLDVALRTTRRSSPILPVGTGIVSIVQAGSSLALGRSSWSIWLLACGASAALFALERRNRPRINHALVAQGARPPDAAQSRHDARQVRWYAVMAALFVAGICCQVLARHDPLRSLSALGVLLTIVCFGLAVIAGWRAVRGPDPEPIVLWYRER